uniref:Exostosin domain-containing protein n=1 Tax=Angiostrongylus cantonensis TaxID=6313 RepID=A0A0K0CTQ3_ANGCA
MPVSEGDVISGKLLRLLKRCVTSLFFLLAVFVFLCNLDGDLDANSNKYMKRNVSTFIRSSGSRIVDKVKLGHAEESDFLPDGEVHLEPQRKFKSLQLVGDEVDDMPKKTVGSQQCFRVFHQDSSQQCARLNPDHVVQTGPSSQIETVPGTNAVHYTVQNTSLTYEMEANHPTQHEVGPSTSFRRSLDQGGGAHHVPVLQSSSKSQPRRPILRDLGYDSLAFPVQEYVGCEWNGIGHKGYGNFTEAPGERSDGRFADDWQEQSTLRPLRTIQRSYFPPNLLPTEKMKYLLVNYKNACARYFPFANKALLESDTRYRPVEPVASDLFRFHSRGAHIHGFFRTVIDSRDPPHPGWFCSAFFILKCWNQYV